VGFGDIPIRRDVTTRVIPAYIILSTVLLTFAFNNFQTLNQDIERLKVSVFLLLFAVFDGVRLQCDAYKTFYL